MNANHVEYAINVHCTKNFKKLLAMNEKEMYWSIMRVTELARSLHITTEQLRMGFCFASHNMYYLL